MIAVIARQRTALALGLLLILGAIISQVVADRAPRSGPMLSSRDAGADGVLALALWLERLGYQVTRLEGSQTTPGGNVGYLFVLLPTRAFTRVESRGIVDWVRRGGTLFYVPNPLPTVGVAGIEMADGLGSELDVGVRFGSTLGRAAQPAVPVLPFLTAPPGSSFVLRDSTVLDLRDDSWVPLIVASPAGKADTIAAVRRFGTGQVYAVASRAFFANSQLGVADNSALVLNALARGSTHHVVAFDEYHHGDVEPRGLAEVVRGSPWGWALVYAVVLTFLFAVWSGRRFGPPIVREDLPGRSAGDYVAAFAGLLQRRVVGSGDAVAWAQAQYVRLVRHGLARAHGIRSDLPAPDLARLLADRRPIDATALADEIAALDGPPLGERGLLQRMRALEPILKVLLGGDTRLENE